MSAQFQENEMLADATIKILTLQVRGVQASWNDTGCSIEHNIFKKVVNKAASSLEAYIRTLGILSDFKIIDRFDSNGSAWIEVHQKQTNHELDGINSEISALREQISTQLSRHVEVVNAISKGDELRSSLADQNHKAISALEAFMSSVDNVELEFNFNDNKKNTVIQSIKPIDGRIIDQEPKTVSGFSRNFDEVDETVTLHRSDDFRGNLVLRVKDAAKRKPLILAQLEGRLLTVQYIPQVHSLRPDKELPSGELDEIISVGPMQTDFTF